MRLRVGDKVKMTENFKRKMYVSSKEHILEFGHCIGVVCGFTDYHNKGDELSMSKIGPEVNIRWTTHNGEFIYCYLPRNLELA